MEAGLFLMVNQDCKNWKCPGGLKGRWMIAQGNALGSGDRVGIAFPGCRSARGGVALPWAIIRRPFRPRGDRAGLFYLIN